MPFWKRMKDYFRIRNGGVRKWLISYLIILLIPVMICLVIYTQSYLIIKETLTNANVEMMKQVVTSLDFKFKELSNVEIELHDNAKLGALAELEQPMGVEDKYRILEFSKKQMEFTKFLENFLQGFYIYFPKGDYILRTGGYSTLQNGYTDFLENTDLIFDQWKELVRSKKFRTLLPVRGEGENLLMYIHSLPVIGETVSMNFVASINQDYLREIIRPVRTLRNSEFLILDANYTVLFREGGTGSGTVIEPGELDQHGTVFSKEVNGEECVVSQFSSDVLDITYVSIVPCSVFWEKAVNLKYLAVIMLCLCVAIGIVLSFVFSKRNYKPINQLFSMLKKDGQMQQEEHAYIVQAVEDMMADRDNIRRRLTIETKENKKVVLSKLLAGGTLQRAVDDVLKLYQIDFPDGNFVVVLFALDDYQDFFENRMGSDREAKYLVENAVMMLVEEIVSNRFVCNITDINSQVACIVNFPFLDDAACIQEIRNMVETARAFIQEGLYVSLTIAISGVHKETSEIHTAYEEALKALEKRIVTGKNSVICYLDIERETTGSSYRYSLEKEMHIINNIRQGNAKEALALVDDIFDKNLSADTLSIDMIKYLMYDLSGTLLKAIGELDEEICGTDLVGEIMQCKTVQETKQIIENVIIHVCGNINSGKKSHNIQLKDDIISYIQKNYNNKELCNTMIADVFHIKPAYLSRFFKEQTGDNILSFIHKTRVEAAKKLLEEQQYNLDTVSQKVGYHSSVALIRNFKKYVGITPGEYREMR